MKTKEEQLIVIKLTPIGENISLIKMLYTFLLGGFWEKMKRRGGGTRSPPSARSCLRDTFCQVLKATTALPVGYL